MNAHQRRVASRRRHMLLPVGAALDIGCLTGRHVYLLGKYQCFQFIYPRDGVRAKVSQHLYPHGVTVEVTTLGGEQVCLNTRMRGLRLMNPSDRAPRPWWASLRRRNRKGLAA